MVRWFIPPINTAMLVLARDERGNVADSSASTFKQGEGRIEGRSDNQSIHDLLQAGVLKVLLVNFFIQNNVRIYGGQLAQELVGVSQRS